jgi:hypothetical protein
MLMSYLMQFYSCSLCCFTYVGRCPEDHLEMEEFVCQPDPAQCTFDDQDVGQWRHQIRQNNSELEQQHKSNQFRFRNR